MNAQTQMRSLGSLLVLVVVVILNTAMIFMERYGPEHALPIYAVSGTVLVLALRYQRRLSPLALAGLQALPLLLIVLSGLRVI